MSQVVCHLDAVEQAAALGLCQPVGGHSSEGIAAKVFVFPGIPKIVQVAERIILEHIQFVRHIQLVSGTNIFWRNQEEVRRLRASSRTAFRSITSATSN